MKLTTLLKLSMGCVALSVLSSCVIVDEGPYYYPAPVHTTYVVEHPHYHHWYEHHWYEHDVFRHVPSYHSSHEVHHGHATYGPRPHHEHHDHDHHKGTYGH